MVPRLQNSRRGLLKLTAIACAAGALPSVVTAADPARKAEPLKIGVATYTFRKFSLDDTIKLISRVGLRYVSIKDFHMPMKSTAAERKAVTDKFKAAGITPMSCGVITWKDQDAARAAFEYARDAGIPTIVCNPAPATLATCDKLVKEFDIRLAIHNHGPEDKVWPTPYEAMKAIEALDPRIGVCIDVGHTARAGVDPAEAIVRCKDRLFDIHLKDIHSAQKDGKPIEQGRGALNTRAMISALLSINYSYLAAFEYEKDADDPLAGLAESAGYVNGIVAALTA